MLNVKKALIPSARDVTRNAYVTMEVRRDYGYP